MIDSGAAGSDGALSDGCAGRNVDHGHAAAAEDPRMPLKLPDMRGAFLEHMRHHMDSLDVMAQLATADFKGAKVARERLVPGSGAGFGRYLPVEFREMCVGMHRAAADFAEVVRARHYRRLDPGPPFGEVGDDDRCDRRRHQRSRNRFLHRAAAER